ncbi:MAG: replicative DNA helicase [Acidobacteriota bacterium]|nr:MAG: replicative DNA helicase [Acidobacteriota bacterium]
MPHSVEAERAVLGSILLRNRESELAFERLRPEGFYHAPHQRIFEAMERIRTVQENPVIDLITLRDDLDKRGLLEEAGGADYLASLVDGLPKELNIPSYVSIVHDKYVLRELIKRSEAAIAECFKQEQETETVLGEAEKKVFQLAEELVRLDYVLVGSLTQEVLQKTEEIAKHGAPVGVPTGFTDFDHITGGLQASDLVVVAARPSVGKTTFCLNVAVNAALREGKTVAVFSLEDSRDNIVRRMLCTVAKVDAEKVSRGRGINREDWANLIRAEAELRQAPLYIDDSPSTIFQIGPKARRLQRKHGLDLLIVDYLQLILSPSEIRFENRTLEIAAYTRYLKNLAKELKIPVIAVSQLSRAPEQRPDHRPRLADLRESGAIEQDADLVAFLYRPDMYKRGRNGDREEADSSGLARPNNLGGLAPETPRSELIIAKHRNGPTGVIQLVFIPQQTRFESAAPSYAASEEPAPLGGEAELQ